MSFDPETGDAVVVDSPVSEPDLSVSYTEQTGDDVTTSTAEDTSGTDTAAAPPTNPDEWKDTLKTQYGYDVSGYSNENDARQAIRDITERFAVAGMQRQMQPQQPLPEELQEKPPKADDFEDDPTDDSPAAKKLRAQLKKLKAENDAIQTAAREAQIAQDQAQKQEILNRAVGAIDKLANPKYGVGATRDLWQLRNARALLELADAIYIGMASSNQDIPSIETLIELAVDYEARSEARASQKPSVQQKTEEKTLESSNLAKKFERAMDKQNPVATVRKAQTDPNHRKEVARNTVDSFKKDAKFMQAFREIANRK